MSKRKPDAFKDSNEKKSSGRSRSSYRNDIKKLTSPKDELEVCNDQTYDEILQRFNSQRQRMKESPEKGDVIKSTNSSIALEEEYREVIPCDAESKQKSSTSSSSSHRDKERVISTKICSDGCNYIKETVIERTHFSQEGLVVTTKHIIEKCGIEDEQTTGTTKTTNDVPSTGNDKTNKANETPPSARKSRSSHFDEGPYLRPSFLANPKNREYLEKLENKILFQRPSTSVGTRSSENRDSSVARNSKISARKNSLKVTGEKSNVVETPDVGNKLNQRPSKIANTSAKRIDFTPDGSDGLQSLKSMSSLNRRDSSVPSDRSLLSSSKYSKDCADDKFDGISIQLYASSASSRSNSRSRNHQGLESQCSCECEDVCCLSPSTSQSQASKLLAEIIIPSEYNRGVELPKANQENLVIRRNRRNSSRCSQTENSDDTLMTQRNRSPEDHYKTVTSSTRKEATLRQPNNFSNDNINTSESSEMASSKARRKNTEFRLCNETTISDMECNRSETLKRRPDNHQQRTNHNDYCCNNNNNTSDEDNDDLRRSPSKYRQQLSLYTTEDTDTVSSSHFCKNCQPDGETHSGRMERSANSKMKKPTMKECSEYSMDDINARQNSRTKPIRAIMIPLLYVAPTEDSSPTCRCGGNQPQIIQLNGFQSAVSGTRPPLSLKYRLIPDEDDEDEDDDEDCINTTKRIKQNDRSNRRRSTGGGKPLPLSTLQSFTFRGTKARYSEDIFVLYSSKSIRCNLLENNHNHNRNHSSTEREKESSCPSSSESSAEGSSSKSSLEDEEESKSSSEEEISTTSFLKAGEQSEKTSNSPSENVHRRRSSLKNQSTDTPKHYGNRSSSKDSSYSDNDVALDAKRKWPQKFNLLAEVRLKDGNAHKVKRSQSGCCEETYHSKSDSQCNSRRNNCTPMCCERPCPSDPHTGCTDECDRRRSKSCDFDSEDWTRGNCCSQKCANVRRNSVNCCSAEELSKSCKQFKGPDRSSSLKKDKGSRRETLEKDLSSESENSADMVIRSETNEEVDYYRENRIDSNRGVSFREETFRKSSVNVTNATQIQKSSARTANDDDDDDDDEENDKDFMMQDESSVESSSGSNDSDESGTECENTEDCCNVNEKCTQTEPCCCQYCQFMVPLGCNDYCSTEINSQFASSSACDYQCFEPQMCNPDPMGCSYFQQNDRQIFCSCNGSCQTQSCCSSSLPSKCQSTSTENGKKPNEDTKEARENSYSKETKEENMTQSENGKNPGEKCTQTEFSVQYSMSQQQNFYGFCCPPQSCMPTCPPMAPQCVHQCFGHQPYSECCSVQPDDPSVLTCNISYTPPFHYPASTPISSCQAPCSFPFQDSQPCCPPTCCPPTCCPPTCCPPTCCPPTCCPPTCQQHTSNNIPFCDTFDEQPLPTTSCKK